MSFRRDAAALILIATVAAAGLLMVRASTGLGAAAADVTLQIVPRGPGTVTSSVPDKTTGDTSCTQRSEPVSCIWTVDAGANVVLTAVPNGSGDSFVGWSTPDCPGTGECRLTVDEDQSVTALFSKLTLDIDLSGNDNGDESVTSDPPGINCPVTACQFDFPARSIVRLTVNPGSSTFTSFPYGCTSVQGNVCTVVILDDPQSVGVQFNNAGGPTPPDVVDVSMRVRKAGDGSGRVTATGIDCGNVCSAKFKYGKLYSFAVAVDPGSLFAGWGGICASDNEQRCTLPVGPITLIRPKFVKEAPPSAPGALTASATTETSITVRWGASTDDTGVKGYEVYVGSASSPRQSPSGTTATIDGLTCGTSYPISVLAVDRAGNRSARTSGQFSTAVCPLKVQFLGAKVVPLKGGKRLVVTLRSSVPTKGSAALFVAKKRVARAGISLRAGKNALGFRMPRGSGRRNVRLLLRLVDPKGGARNLTFRMTVRL